MNDPLFPFMFLIILVMVAVFAYMIGDLPNTNLYLVTLTDGSPKVIQAHQCQPFVVRNGNFVTCERNGKTIFSEEVLTFESIEWE